MMLAGMKGMAGWTWPGRMGMLGPPNPGLPLGGNGIKGPC